MQTTSAIQATSSSNLCANHVKSWNGNVHRPFAGATFTNLRWAARSDEGMGGFRSLVAKKGHVVLSPSQVMVVRKRPDTNTVACAAASFTSKQAALVKDTWAILKRDAAHHGMALFLTVFEIAPAAKRLFSFLKDSDVPLEKNLKLRAHAMQVFVIICEASASLGSTGQVSTPGSSMKDMAKAHSLSGVVDEHYEVVRYSLLKTIQAGLPADMWNEEVKEAWQNAYDELVRVMRSEEAYAVAS